jgi:hypothetical protein
MLRHNTLIVNFYLILMKICKVNVLKNIIFSSLNKKFFFNGILKEPSGDSRWQYLNIHLQYTIYEKNPEIVTSKNIKNLMMSVFFLIKYHKVNIVLYSVIVSQLKIINIIFEIDSRGS